ncbi:MAG: TonB-dependent receptor [Bacteroides sp.]|nr:TonB-dependent receptor [Bacteroides sp.]
MVDTVFQIDTIVISAKKITPEIIPAQRLSGKELQRLSVVSVADAIRYFSGVQIKDYGGIGGLKTVNIRSMGTQHVGVFYDGIQLGNAQNGQVDLGRFSMDNMEAISLYNGQKSSIFQPAKDFASAGSVYMTTRKPDFEGDKKDKLKISLTGGSFETINPSVLWEHRVGSRLDLSLNAEYMYTSGRYKFSYKKKEGYDTTEVRRNGDVRAFRMEGGLYGRIEDGEWRIKVYGYNSERGYPGASVREEPGKFKHEDRQWDTNFFIQSSWRKYRSERYSLLLNGKYAYDYLHYLSDPRLDVTTMYVNNHYRQQETYFSAAHKVTLAEGWRVSVASDLQHNTLHADLVDFVYPSRYTVLNAVATAFDFKRLKVQGSLLYTYVHDRTKLVGASAGDKNEWTPTVVAMYRPFRERDLSLRAFYKRIFRMPTLNDLYYTFIGNKYLNPEYTTQYNVGVVYRRAFPGKSFRSLDIQVDAYLNQVDNKIIAMPTSNQFQWTMVNLGYVEIRSLDAGVQGEFRLGKVSVHPRLNYTYQKAQDLTDSSEEWYGGQIPYIPWHSGSAIIGAAYKGWDLNYSFIYTGERYESRANIPENYAQPWYTHDMSLSRRIPLRKTDLRVTAELNNIFNQQYEVVQCYPMPGTNFKIKINWML